MRITECLELPAGLAEREQTFLSVYWEIVSQYPHNRTLLYAWIFCAYELGLSSLEVGQMLGCSDRNIRYILAEVKTSQRGEGKTGRPAKAAAPEGNSEATAIGLTRFGGLWLLLPFILQSNMLAYCQWLSVAGVVGTPLQFVLTLFALAVCGYERVWAMDDVTDRGFALFTGRWIPLRSCQLYTWFSQLNAGAVSLFYAGTKFEEWRLVSHYPAIVSNDEHTVGHDGGPDMPQGKVAKTGRLKKAHQLFMTYHLAARRFVGLTVTSTRTKLCHVAATCLLEMHQARQLAGGDATAMLEILDGGSYSQQAHRELLTLKDTESVDYLTRLRRTAKNVAEWDRGLQWGEYPLEPYVRGSEWGWKADQRHRLVIAQTTTTITGLTEPLQTILIIDLDKIAATDPKAKYAAVFTSTLPMAAWLQADIYSWRQDHELAFRDSIQALGLDAKPKGYVKEQPHLPLDHPEQVTPLTTHRIELATWVRSLAYNRVRDLLDHLPDEATSWTVATAQRKLIQRTALLQHQEDCFWVIFEPFPGDKILAAYFEWVNQADFAIPWLNNAKLRFAIAPHALAAPLPNTLLRKLLLTP